MKTHDCPQPGSGGVHSDPQETGRCLHCGARTIGCDHYRPDHNGECLNCDEYADMHDVDLEKESE